MKNTTKLPPQQSDPQSSQQPQQQQQSQQPQYAQIEGQTIKLSGLDYNLLKQEKEKEEKEKKNFMANLKDKISIISADVLGRVVVGDGDGVVGKEGKEGKEGRNGKVDQRYSGLVKVLGNGGNNHVNEHKNKKSQTYLLFQLDDFGRRTPIYLQKRLGKASNKPVLPQFDDKFLQQFHRLLQIKQNKSNDPKLLLKMVDKGNEDDDDDDIFGNDSEEQEEKGKGKGKMGEKAGNVSIEIGKKLNFGLDDDDIFGPQKRDRPIQPTPTQPQPSQANDKYFFMRKRQKKSLEDDDAGYGECFHQSGPSLKQLVDLKKQGIEFYGDLKEFKPKEKKAPNIHKQYEMVKKIIEKNSKK